MSGALKFTSVEQTGVSYSATAGGENDKDVSQAGEVIGFNTYGYVTSPKTSTATGWVAINLKGGFLYGVFRPSSSAPAPGTVTGGTGAPAESRCPRCERVGAVAGRVRRLCG